MLTWLLDTNLVCKLYYTRQPLLTSLLFCQLCGTKNIALLIIKYKDKILQPARKLLVALVINYWFYFLSIKYIVYEGLIAFVKLKSQCYIKGTKKGENERIKKGGKEEEYLKNVYQPSFKSKAFETRNINR